MGPHSGFYFWPKWLPPKLPHTSQNERVEGVRGWHVKTGGLFRNHYPQGKTFEIHAFEVDPKFKHIKLNKHGFHEKPDDSYRRDKNTTFHNAAAWTDYGCIAMGGIGAFATAFKAKFVSSNTTEMVSPAQCARLMEKQPGKLGPVPTVDMAHFLTKTLGLTASNSFVVLKVDIEGPEWVVMDHLRSAGALVGLVKETMIECHWDHHGGPFKGIPLSECHRQQQRLRDEGVFAHEWF